MCIRDSHHLLHHHGAHLTGWLADWLTTTACTMRRPIFIDRTGASSAQPLDIPHQPSFHQTPQKPPGSFLKKSAQLIKIIAFISCFFKLHNSFKAKIEFFQTWLDIYPSTLCSAMLQNTCFVIHLHFVDVLHLLENRRQINNHCFPGIICCNSAVATRSCSPQENIKRMPGFFYMLLTRVPC